MSQAIKFISSTFGFDTGERRRTWMAILVLGVLAAVAGVLTPRIGFWEPMPKAGLNHAAYALWVGCVSAFLLLMSCIVALGATLLDKKPGDPFNSARWTKKKLRQFAAGFFGGGALVCAVTAFLLAASDSTWASTVGVFQTSLWAMTASAGATAVGLVRKLLGS